jgi:hypothetical protein
MRLNREALRPEVTPCCQDRGSHNPWVVGSSPTRPTTLGHPMCVVRPELSLVTPRAQGCIGIACVPSSRRREGRSLDLCSDCNGP